MHGDTHLHEFRWHHTQQVGSCKHNSGNNPSAFSASMSQAVIAVQPVLNCGGVDIQHTAVYACTGALGACSLLMHSSAAIVMP
jgi:hypothetical protein